MGACGTGTEMKLTLTGKAYISIRRAKHQMSVRFRKVQVNSVKLNKVKTMRL